MAVPQSGGDDGLIGRLVTRLRDETPKIDAATVERARAAQEAAKMARRRLSTQIDMPQPGVETRVVSRAISGGDEHIAVEEKWPYAGLAPMTRVRTSFGDVYAVALRKGDLVRTRSGEFKPIVWLDRIMLDDGFLDAMRDAHPIAVSAGSIARGLPKNDVLLSPRQVICTQGTFLEPRQAGDLTGRPNIRRKTETGLSYTLFHLGRSEEVQCEGMWIRMEV